MHKEPRGSPFILHSRVDGGAVPAALYTLLHADLSTVSETDGASRCDLESVLLLASELALCSLIQRLNVGRSVDVVSLASSQLVVLVTTPEDNVSTPPGFSICVQGSSVSDVVHDSGHMLVTSTNTSESDRNDSVGGLVVLEQRRQGRDLSGSSLNVSPAAVSKRAVDAGTACESISSNPTHASVV